MADQDRRMLLAIVLSLGVYLVWFGLYGPQPMEDAGLTESGSEETIASTDSTNSSVADAGTTLDPSTTNEPNDVSAELSTDSSRQEEIGETAVDSTYEALIIPFADAEYQVIDGQYDGIIEGTESDTGSWTAEIHSNNGAMRDIVLDEYSTAPGTSSIWGYGIGKVLGTPGTPESWSPYEGALSSHTLLSEDGALLLAGAGDLNDDGAGDLTSDGAYSITEEEGVIIARSMTGSGLSITKRYTTGVAPYTVNVEVDFHNTSTETFARLWVGVADRMTGDAGRFLAAVRPNAYVDQGNWFSNVENIYDIGSLEGDGVEVMDGVVDWFGIGDRYFMGVLIPEDTSQGRLIVDTLDGGRTGSFLVYDSPLSPDEQQTFSYTAYIGPKSLDILEPMGEEMEAAVEFGWFGVFSKPLLWLLKSLYGFVGNWGVAIILLTLLIKLLFFRLTQKTYESSQRMQLIQPQLKEIREKFKDNKEIQTKETMNLFKEHNVNPMGSCLPMLLQLPVWFALYNTMLYSVELYNTSFLIFEDLTASDPYGILPTLYVLLMVGQQKMMPMASMDPTQRKVMKMMPLIFGFFMYTFPSGLVLYFCVNMLLTIFQQWIIKKNLKPLDTNESAA